MTLLPSSQSTTLRLRFFDNPGAPCPPSLPHPKPEDHEDEACLERQAYWPC